MTGTLEAEIVAVRWAEPCRRYLEAYENEDLFWEHVAEAGAPERAYRLEGDRLVEWDYRPGLDELRADMAADESHRHARRAVGC